MKMSSQLPIAAAMLGLLLASSCDSVRQTPPLAQLSSLEAAGALVRVHRGQPFAPACLIVSSGTTVEWRNLSSRSSIIVLSVRDPYELSSPALLAPYNYVPPETSDECILKENGVCIETVPFSFWRHTFSSAGIFDYKDSSGSASASATGSYGYGMPTGSMSTGGTAVGTVCVTGDGVDCQKVCCLVGQTGQCAAGVQCVNGRCGGVTL
jgi:plastocyanin